MPSAICRFILASIAIVLSPSAQADQPLIIQGSTTFAARLMEPYQELITQRSGVALTAYGAETSPGVFTDFSFNSKAGEPWQATVCLTLLLEGAHHSGVVAPLTPDPGFRTLIDLLGEPPIGDPTEREPQSGSAIMPPDNVLSPQPDGLPVQIDEPIAGSGNPALFGSSVGGGPST